MRRTIEVVVAGVLSCAIRAGGQEGWVPHPANPVLRPGGTPWDAAALGQPTCAETEGVVRMWYTGAATDLRGRVLLAESADGVTWTRQPVPALDVGATGAWDAWAVDTPAVTQSQDRYFLYYFGQRQAGSVDGGAIGLATSENGMAFERVGAAPVLEPGPPGAWDERWIESPAVVVDPTTGRWLMWYSGVSRDWVVAIGLALSSDGVRWRKHPDNPVLSPAAAGSWDDAWIAVPTVMPLRSGLWMFYSGVSAQDLLDGRVDAAAVGFAWSLDGARWLGRRAIPVFGPAGVGAPGPWAPTVLLDGTSRTPRMWYETSAGIALATASLPAPLRRAAPERHTPDQPPVLEPVHRERGMQ